MSRGARARHSWWGRIRLALAASSVFLMLVAPTGCRWVRTPYPSRRIRVKYPAHNSSLHARMALWSGRGDRIYYTGADTVGFERGELGLIASRRWVCSVTVSGPFENKILTEGRLLAVDWETDEIAALTSRELRICSAEDGKVRLSRPHPPEGLGLTRARSLRFGVQHYRLVVPALSKAYLRTGMNQFVWDLSTGEIRRTPKLGVTGFSGGPAEHRIVVSGWNLSLLNVKTDVKTDFAKLEYSGRPYEYDIEDGSVRRDARYALFKVGRDKKHSEVWLVRLEDFKAIRVARVAWGLGCSISPDGNRICVSVGGKRLHWWRLDPDWMDHHLIPRLYVTDISEAYADLDGPKAFDVRDRLGGEWHPLKIEDERAAGEAVPGTP